VGVVAFGEQRGELVPDGFDEPRWKGRHGGVRVGAFGDSPIIPHTSALLPAAYCRKLLTS
jgi:hypothetical protein